MGRYAYSTTCNNLWSFLEIQRSTWIQQSILDTLIIRSYESYRSCSGDLRRSKLMSSGLLHNDKILIFASILLGTLDDISIEYPCRIQETLRSFFVEFCLVEFRCISGESQCLLWIMAERWRSLWSDNLKWDILWIFQRFTILSCRKRWSITFFLFFLQTILW